MTRWKYGDVHECPLRPQEHIADDDCIAYVITHGDWTCAATCELCGRTACECPTVVPEVDLVNHPPHYTGGPPCPGCGRAIECIDITRHLPFNPGNTVKYVWRRFFGRKAGESNVEGLKKAVFYLNDEIERLKAQALTDEPGSK